ncbi:hypothetical protein CDEST_07880 [Colletotrichum destructivum]|uniref:C2H2-type domain-containing protein n=1 Tax=Colletotrichum destructivum TaxID=34406 RepID=A0AAX4IHL7_9PEZI|nr:hypothetical protein CDEST_07880 [Colletotrichum destructivum]
MACPYLKHDPEVYVQRRCRGAAFKSISRLKAHLHSNHSQDPNCLRCRRVFTTDEDVHRHMESEDCERVKDVVVEGFDRDQKERLQSKKRGGVGVKSDEEKWKDIFRILFPDCDEIPGPYYSLSFDEPLESRSTSQSERRDAKRRLPDDNISQLEEETSLKIRKITDGDLSETKQRELVAAIVQDILLPRIRQSCKGEEQPAAESAAAVVPSADVEGSFGTGLKSQNSLGAGLGESLSSCSSGAISQLMAHPAEPGDSVVPGNGARDEGVLNVPQTVSGTGIEEEPLPLDVFGDSFDLGLLYSYDPSFGDWAIGIETDPAGISTRWVSDPVDIQPRAAVPWDDSVTLEGQPIDGALPESELANEHVSGVSRTESLTTRFGEESFSWVDGELPSRP